MVGMKLQVVQIQEHVTMKQQLAAMMNHVNLIHVLDALTLQHVTIMLQQR